MMSRLSQKLDLAAGGARIGVLSLDLLGQVLDRLWEPQDRKASCPVNRAFERAEAAHRREPLPCQLRAFPALERSGVSASASFDGASLTAAVAGDGGGLAGLCCVCLARANGVGWCGLARELGACGDDEGVEQVLRAEGVHGEHGLQDMNGARFRSGERLRAAQGSIFHATGFGDVSVFQATVRSTAMHVPALSEQLANADLGGRKERQPCHMVQTTPAPTALAVWLCIADHGTVLFPLGHFAYHAMQLLHCQLIMLPLPPAPHMQCSSICSSYVAVDGQVRAICTCALPLNRCCHMNELRRQMRWPALLPCCVLLTAARSRHEHTSACLPHPASCRLHRRSYAEPRASKPLPKPALVSTTDSSHGRTSNFALVKNGCSLQRVPLYRPKIASLQAPLHVGYSPLCRKNGKSKQCLAMDDERCKNSSDQLQEALALAFKASRAP